MELVNPRRRHTIEEYLRIDRDSTEKLEFVDGRILKKTGLSLTHSLITANFGRALHNRIKGTRCRVYASNRRIRINSPPAYAYPDTTVICAKVQLDPDDQKQETVTNPRVIVEVLSPTTEAY